MPTDSSPPTVLRQADKEKTSTSLYRIDTYMFVLPFVPVHL